MPTGKGKTIGKQPGRRRRPRTPSARRERIDLVVLTLLCALVAYLAARFNLLDTAMETSHGLTGTTRDAVAALLVLVPVATTIYAHRRYREAAAVRRTLVHLSLHDPLTGLPNRRLLVDWLASDITRAQQHSWQVAALFVDLDRFKYVNDTHGHEVGDRLMRAVADRLRHLISDGDRLVRFGGDEFVIVASGLGSAEAAAKLARKAIAIVEAPFTIGEESIKISASVGVAIAEHRGVKPEDVLRDADVAMYQAKTRGPGHVVTFDRSVAGTLTPAVAEEQIRAALEAGDFHLHYQPVVDLVTGRIVGAEALLRWISPSSGTMSPGEFIPILEETGLIVPVGTWVLQQACRQAVRLREELPDHPPIGITVNVSARQVAQVGFGDVVANALADAGVNHGQIHLEITEGALMHDVSSAWAVLRQAKALGVKLALDDFGTGYSSLSYIRRFSLDMLKIDKSFIDGIDSSPEDRAIVEHVIGMANALGMATVAEGVERPEQLAWLRQLGCRLAQGYVLSRPISPEDLEDLLRKRDAEPFQLDPPPRTAGRPARGADAVPFATDPVPSAPAPAPASSSYMDVFDDIFVVDDDASSLLTNPPPVPRRRRAEREATDESDDVVPSPTRGERARGRGRRLPALPTMREYRPSEDSEQLA